MRGKPAAVETCVTLHQPEACRVFSQGSCPWITGPWQWRAAQAPGRGGVESWRVVCGGVEIWRVVCGGGRDEGVDMRV